jgi:hypothetical protein
VTLSLDGGASSEARPSARSSRPYEASWKSRPALTMGSDWEIASRRRQRTRKPSGSSSRDQAERPVHRRRSLGKKANERGQ